VLRLLSIGPNRTTDDNDVVIVIFFCQIRDSGNNKAFIYFVGLTTKQPTTILNCMNDDDRQYQINIKIMNNNVETRTQVVIMEKVHLYC